jgi:pilus assembly protein CpaE
MYRQQESPRALLVEPAAAPLAPAAVEPATKPLLKAAIAGSDRASNATLCTMLEATGAVKEVLEWAWLTGMKLRDAQDVPDVVFIDLAAGMGSEFLFAQELVKLNPAVHIIACSAKNETNAEFLLQAMRSGIREFLQKPFNRIEVAQLMHRLSQENEVRPVKKVTGGKLICVLGTKGGVGTSTVAVNLAVQLAQIRTKRTLLVDFSRPMGDVTALLDLKPSFQIRDAVENVKRIDATLFSGLLTPHESGLQVLAGATRLDDLQDASPAAMERVLEIARQDFDFVVVDFGSYYSPEWRDLLHASEILLISEADLPGLAKLHKHVGALANLRVPSERVHLVINRWHRQDEEALAQVENDMKTPVFARLPNNFKQVREATVRGIPVGKNGDPLTEGFGAMAARLAGTRTSSGRKKSLLGQFLSL